MINNWQSIFVYSTSFIITEEEIIERQIVNDEVSVYQLLKGKCNIFLITANKRCILVDTNTKKYKLSLLKKFRYFENNGYVLEGVIITHAHYDYIENAGAVQ